MPLPLGHTAVGWAVNDFCSQDPPSCKNLRILLLVAVLANLPDLDILFGLLIQSDGYAFHRGPTHSLLFALAMGWLAARLARAWPIVPPIKFPVAAGIILSHILADVLFTASPVSFFWPLEVHWSMQAPSGWGQVFNTVLGETVQDTGIISVSVALIILNRLRRRYRGPLPRCQRVSARSPRCPARKSHRPNDAAAASQEWPCG